MGAGRFGSDLATAQMHRLIVCGDSLRPSVFFAWFLGSKDVLRSWTRHSAFGSDLFGTSFKCF